MFSKQNKGFVGQLVEWSIPKLTICSLNPNYKRKGETNMSRCAARQGRNPIPFRLPCAYLIMLHVFRYTLLKRQFFVCWIIISVFYNRRWYHKAGRIRLVLLLGELFLNFVQRKVHKVYLPPNKKQLWHLPNVFCETFHLEQYLPLNTYKLVTKSRLWCCVGFCKYRKARYIDRLTFWLLKNCQPIRVLKWAQVAGFKLDSTIEVL